MTYFSFVNPLRIVVENLEHERSRWPYWLPVALAAGVVMYFSLPFEPPLGMLSIPPVVFLAAWFLRSVSWPSAIATFVLGLVATGFSAAQIETLIEQRPMLDREVGYGLISGRVASTDILPDGIRIILSHPQIEGLAEEFTPEKVRVKFNDLTLEEVPPTGAEVSFNGQLSPFSEPVSPSATDFRRIAYFKNLGGLGWSRDVPTITNASPDDYTWGERFDLMLERARKTLARHVYERLPGDVGAMTAARLNGEQSAISPKVMDAMRASGLVHLLAVSGANVTVMALLIYFPLRMLLALSPFLALRFPIKKWAACGAIFSALSFTFLVGSQAAVMRSLIMVALAMIAITIDRYATPLRLVMLSALLAMLFAPSATMGPSFQMSFAAVFCLIATAALFPREEHKPVPIILSPLHSFFSHFGRILRASLIATAAIAPFSIYHFQTFNIYGIISNLVAIPLTSFWVMPFTVIAYFTAPFGWDGFFIDMAGLGNALTIRIATTIAAWPHATLTMPTMPDPALVAIVLGGLWLCLWRKKWRYAGIIPICIAMTYPLYTTTADFFFSPSGKSWGVVLADGRLAVSSVKREGFASEQWAARLGGIDRIDAKALPPENPELHCDEDGCSYRRGDFVIAMPAVEGAALEDCEHADAIVANFTINECPSKLIVDAKALTKFGAHTLTFTRSKPFVEIARTDRGLRPWSSGWSDRIALGLAAHE